MDFYFILVIASHVPVVFVALYALLKSRYFDIVFKRFTYFLYFNGAIQLCALVLLLFSINNLPLLHILVPAGYWCLSGFYNSVLTGFLDKRIIPVSTILFVVFSLINTSFFQPLTTFNSNALTVESILLLIMAVSTYVFFVQQAPHPHNQKVTSGLHWINSGLFIYHSSSLIIFYFGKTIIEQFSNTFALYTWVIHSVFSIIMYICFFVGLWKQPKN
jgi:hypothetical protein